MHGGARASSRKTHHPWSPAAHRNPQVEGTEEIVRYFTSDDEADRACASDHASIERALSLAGAWQELDAEDGPDPLDELDRIRHQSTPSLPLKL